MRLKTLKSIEIAIDLVLFLITLPFLIINKLLLVLAYPFGKVVEWKEYLMLVIGNKLLLLSKEVKDGTIKNKGMLKTLTALGAYVRLKYEDYRLTEK